jgi:PAS domain S-box-containing protein
LNALRACTLTILLFAFAVSGAWYFHAPFSFLLVASMVTSVFAGRTLGLFAMGLSALTFYFLFLERGNGATLTANAVGRPALFIAAMVCVSELIHARRRSERSSLPYDVEFHALAETCPDCILILDAEQIIRFSNPSVSRLFGYSLDDVLGMPVSRLLPEAESGEPPNGELLARHKSGGRIHVESSCGRFSDKTTVFLRDISDRKRALARLEASEANLRLTLDTIPGLVYSRPPDGELDYANRHLMGFFGYTLEDVRNGIWRDGLHPEEREFVLNTMKIGSSLGKPYSFECRHRLEDGTYGWIHSAVEPLVGPDGRVVRWYGLITDINDRKKAEKSLRETQTKLTIASRIAVASELTASIVHEISQPIAAMVANGQSCLRWLGTSPPNYDNATAAVARIVRDGKDASDIIKGLRNLFKRAEPQKSPVNLRAIVDEVLMLLQPRTQREGIQIDLQIAPDLPLISGDSIQLQQVLLNLVSNSMDAMRSIVGRPKILVMRARPLLDDSVLTEIEDSGIGVADHEKVFEAFFTTKESGMGMGLSVCKTIISAHGGRLWASPASPFGTVFSFTIPIEIMTVEEAEQ